MTVRQTRLQLGLNQTEFGARLGVKQTTVSSWEQGKLAPTNSLVKMKAMLDNQEAGVRGSTPVIPVSTRKPPETYMDLQPGQVDIPPSHG